MKMKSINILVLSAMALPLAFSCGDSLLDDLNNNTEVSEGDLMVAADYDQAAGMFLTAQKKLRAIDPNTSQPHQYQVQCNIHIDNYAGYMSSTQNFGGNLPTAYAYFKDYCESPKSIFFELAQAALPVMRSADALGLKEVGAMCNIMYCYSALELSDIYGPFPWWDYKQDKQESPLTYTPMPEIYDSLFFNLRQAKAVLENFVNTPAEHQDSINTLLQDYDDICGADVDQWIRFSNTIRLRMALRMSNVDPDRARTEAESAIDDGLIQRSVEYTGDDGRPNPLWAISENWDDTRLNASMENIMKRLNFPLMTVWFNTNMGDISDSEGNVQLPANSDVVGMRTGISLTPRDAANQYVNFSGLSGSFANKSVAILKYSEALFMDAEAGLRWGVSSRLVPRLYELGIQEMFNENNMSDAYSAYYNQTDEDIDTSIDYVDYSNHNNDIAGELTIGVKWDNGADDKTHLEQIITQKWLANFPQGLEAWNDLRRTGYPRIFMNDDIGDGSLDSGTLIRRIPWDASDSSIAQDINTTGIEALGGPNLERTYLWWDVEDPSGLGDNRRF